MSPSSAQFDKTPEGNTPPRSSLPLSIRGTTRLIALLGDPVGHSLSPAMHNAALAAAGIDAAYMALPVKPENLGAAIAGLRAVNFMGANVTLPHKSAVIPFIDEISPLARTLGAVNTIVHRDGKLYGDTTDAAGFIAAFEEAGHSFDDKTIAILGNGGSARTIAMALRMLRNVKHIALVVRSPAKAQSLVAELNSGTDISVHSFEDYAKVYRDYDIVVNTTPLGMYPNVDATPLPAELFKAGQIVYDIVYNPLETKFLREAKERSCAVVGGLGMLVHQGKISFQLWTGQDLPSEIFYDGIRLQQSTDMNHTRQEHGEHV